MNNLECIDFWTNFIPHLFADGGSTRKKINNTWLVPYYQGQSQDQNMRGTNCVVNFMRGTDMDKSP
jgi:hypothetical protein